MEKKFTILMATFLIIAAGGKAQNRDRESSEKNDGYAFTHSFLDDPHRFLRDHRESLWPYRRRETRNIDRDQMEFLHDREDCQR
jgi:hypothetical protein